MTRSASSAAPMPAAEQRARDEDQLGIVGDRREGHRELAPLVRRRQAELELLGRARLDRVLAARARAAVDRVEERAEDRRAAQVADLDPAELVGDDRDAGTRRRRRRRSRSSRPPPA